MKKVLVLLVLCGIVAMAMADTSPLMKNYLISTVTANATPYAVVTITNNSNAGYPVIFVDQDCYFTDNGWTPSEVNGLISAKTWMTLPYKKKGSTVKLLATSNTANVVYKLVDYIQNY